MLIEKGRLYCVVLSHVSSVELETAAVLLTVISVDEEHVGEIQTSWTGIVSVVVLLVSRARGELVGVVLA